MKKTTIKPIIVLVIILLLGLGLYKLIISNLAFSFATMLFVAIIFILLEYWFYMKHAPQPHVGQDGQLNAQDTLDGRRRRFAAMLVGCYGLIAVFAMSYYLYPSKEIFSNNDHHAIVVEGIETNRTNILLAADNKNAFFDDNSLAGSIELQNISASDSSATMHLAGVGMPVYGIIEENKYCKNNVLNRILGLFGEKTINYYEAVDGQSNIHSWSAGEQLELLNCHNETAAKLRVSYYHEREWKYFKLRKTWHSSFILEYTDALGVAHSDTSAFDGIIRSRYSLASLFPDKEPLHGVDLTKIELLRPKARTTKTWKDDKHLVDSSYLVCYLNNSGLGGIRSGGNVTPISASCDVNVKLDGRTKNIGLNNRIPDFRLTADTTGFVAIRYRMPMYRYLGTEGYEEGEDGYYTFMLTTSLMTPSGEVNNQIPKNILLYDVFDHYDNPYQMHPQFISFHRGSTLEPLVLSVLDSRDGHQYQIHAGEHIAGIGTAELGNGTNWIVGFDNMRDASLTRPIGIDGPLSAIVIMVFILILTFLCCWSILLPGKNRTTCIEPIAYIILLSLLAIRLTLLWRVSVFPPYLSITQPEFNKWRSAGGIFYWIIGFSGLLVGLVMFVKRFGYTLRNNKIKQKQFHNFVQRFDVRHWTIKHHAYFPTFKRNVEKPQNLLWPQGKKAYKLIVCLVLYLLCFIIGKVTRMPLFCVGIPVILYFVTDFIINVQVGSRWTDKKNHSYAFFWQGLINMMVASVVLFRLDSGYGLVFIVFAMLSSIVRLVDVYGATPYRKKGNKEGGIRRVGMMIMALLIVLCIVFMRSIVVKLFTGGIGFLIIFGLLVGVFVALTIWTFSGWKKYFVKDLVIVIISILFTIGGGWYLKEYYLPGKPTFNRVLVLNNSPSKVLGKVTNTPDMTKFLQASLNDWVLEEYVERGKDVNSLIGEKGNGYFKLEPHSNVGVSWMTQLTDLSVSRFIIAEQSNLVPILLVFMFFIMAYMGLAFPSDRRWAKSLLVQIPLLLAVQSLLVWMAVTRRFVFLGQDFPMISLISRVNLCMSVIGFLIWILTAIIEHKDIRDLSNNKKVDEDIRNMLVGLVSGDDNNKLYHFVKKYTPYIMGGYMAALVIIIMFGQAERHFDPNKEEGLEVGTYDVVACMDAVKDLITDPDPAIDNVEKLFHEFQKNISGYNLPSGKKTWDITKLGTPQRILQRFCDSIQYDPEDIEGDNAINRIFAQDEEYGPFARAVFNDYLKRHMYQNDIDGLIYIVKDRFVPEENNKVEDVKYSFGCTKHYFRQHLPSRINNSWQGSVIAGVTTDGNAIDRQTEGNVIVYTIPGSWTKDKKQALIVKTRNNSFNVVGKYEPRRLRRNEAYYLSEGEVLAGVGGNEQDLAKYGSGNYLAHNVLINSQPQFIYPMQSDFYWARPLADQIRSYMRRNMNKAEDKEQFNNIMLENSETTLSIGMTRDIVRAINPLAPNDNVAVVVADGDGHVRALVDHRKPKYSVNPNDNRRIQCLEDSLKREGLDHGREAERFFGNKAILHLNNGPGSSQKPIVWSSVTTQYSGWDWNKLLMAGINYNAMVKDKEHDKSHYDATSFAGGKISVANKKRQTHFYSPSSDEGDGNDVNVQFYMRKSSNYYNAIMVYIGSHTKSELEGKQKSNPLFVPRKKSWLTCENCKDYYRDSLFPLVYYDEHLYSFAGPLKESDIDDGILLDGLNQNFGLPSSKKNHLNSYLHRAMLDGKKGNYNAYPAISYFNNERRKGEDGTVKGRTTEGIKMTALGFNSVWLVSPLKMAEMFGKLVSFNSNYRLTIDPNIEKLPYQCFSTDNDANTYLKMRNEQFVKGLNDVYKSGTAKDVYDKVDKNLKQGYYFYGKTGTINGKEKSRSVEDHLLAVIITNRDLAEMNDVEDYMNLRFYVIYIADFAYKVNDKRIYAWTNTDPAIITTVLQSEEFKQYMKGE